MFCLISLVFVQYPLTLYISKICSGMYIGMEHIYNAVVANGFALNLSNLGTSERFFDNKLERQRSARGQPEF
jgi:hypothetical protein